MRSTNTAKVPLEPDHHPSSWLSNYSLNSSNKPKKISHDKPSRCVSKFEGINFLKASEGTREVSQNIRFLLVAPRSLT